MARLAVIGTFYQRWENSAPIARSLFRQTRQADEHWLMCEDQADVAALAECTPGLPGLRLVQLPTPRRGDRYAVIPYSHKINWALDRTDADLIVYLDNGSMPALEKFERMANVLDDPSIGAAYCGQHRTGMNDMERPADSIIEDAYAVLNYTQVMHRRTDDRWTLDMAHADPDLADAMFWRQLHGSLGPFHPTPGGILDEHHIPSAKAVGL